MNRKGISEERDRPFLYPFTFSLAPSSKLMELGQHSPLLSDNLGSFLKVELRLGDLSLCMWKKQSPFSQSHLVSPGNQSLGSLNAEVSGLQVGGAAVSVHPWTMGILANRAWV